MSLVPGGIDSYYGGALNTPLLANPLPFYGYGMNYGIMPGGNLKETSADAFIGREKEHKPLTWKQILLAVVGGGAALFGGIKLLSLFNAKRAKALEEAKKAGFRKGAATAGGIAVLLAGAYAAYKYFTTKNQNQNQSQTVSQNIAKAEKPMTNEQKIAELSKPLQPEAEQPTSAIG